MLSGKFLNSLRCLYFHDHSIREKNQYRQYCQVDYFDNTITFFYYSHKELPLDKESRHGPLVRPPKMLPIHKGHKVQVFSKILLSYRTIKIDAKIPFPCKDLYNTV